MSQHQNPALVKMLQHLTQFEPNLDQIILLKDIQDCINYGLYPFGKGDNVEKKNLNIKEMCHKSEIKFVQMFQGKMIIQNVFSKAHKKVLICLNHFCKLMLRWAMWPTSHLLLCTRKTLYVGHCTCIKSFYLINPCCFLQVDCPDLYRGRHKDDANPSLKYAQEVHSAIKKAKEKGRSVSWTALSFAPEFN